MVDYTDLGTVKDLLKQSQEAEEDNRERAREADHFVSKRDGQWEPHIIQQTKGKPRYTLDKVTPILDQIGGEIENAEFGIKVKPAGGEASEDLAES